MVIHKVSSKTLAVQDSPTINVSDSSTMKEKTDWDRANGDGDGDGDGVRHISATALLRAECREGGDSNHCDTHVKMGGSQSGNF